ncbi:hypothetical protein J437_LFUL007310 [Ladona fulva]|uniref:Reverse transcriptase domain-containing protein n=1 Tax=Ladona fulva TaxID=123851 RepID=A0A8K0KUS9_LADFU|nr:hypothetical protein J437_LFUL007310 [Ladona fulva]
METLNALDRFNLTVINRDKDVTTYVGHAGHNANIDITACSSIQLDSVRDWDIISGATTSDHNMLMSVFALDRVDSKYQGIRKRVCIKNANWPKLTKAMSETETILSMQLCQDAVRNTDAIYRTCAKQMPVQRKRTLHPAGWWNSVLERQKEKVMKARRSSRIRLNPVDSTCSGLHRLIRRSKEQTWMKFVEKEILQDPWSIAYKIVAGKVKSDPLVTGRTLYTLMKEDVSVTKNWKETHEQLLGTFFLEPTRNLASTWRRAIVRDPVPPDTVTELETATESFKNNKAPMSDCLNAEILKAVLPPLKRYCTHLPSKHHGKLFDRIIHRRLDAHFGGLGLPHNSQYCFRPGWSTQMVINGVCQKVTESQQKYVMGLLIDFSNAFNSMEWGILSKRLEVIGAPAYLRNLLKSYSESRRVVVTTPENRIIKNTIRGCPSGLSFGSIIMEDLY